MSKCDICKTEFKDLFIIEDGTKLCARCLEMEAHKKPGMERVHAIVVEEHDDKQRNDKQLN